MGVSQPDLEEAVAGVLAAALAENDPDELERQAEALTSAAEQAVLTPAKLFHEAAEKRARAQILRTRARAIQTVQAASEEVARCEAAWDATEEPEARHAARAFEALQLLQRRHHERAKAYDECATVGEIERLHGVIRDAEATVQGEEARLAVATKARESAFADLEAARGARRRARDSLQQIEASLEAPLSADLPPEDVYRALEFCWPWRVMEDVTRTGPPLSGLELAACHTLAGLYADLLGAIPKGAERRVQAEERQKAAAALHQTSIALPDGRAVNVGQAMGLPGGMAGR